MIDALLAKAAPAARSATRIDAARAADFSERPRRACGRVAMTCMHPWPRSGLRHGVNLTVVGDLLVLGREGLARAGQEGGPAGPYAGLIDYHGGDRAWWSMAAASYTVKAGAGLLRVAHRTGRLAPDLRRFYTRAFREGVDWAACRVGCRWPAPPAPRRSPRAAPDRRSGPDAGHVGYTRGDALHLLGARQTLPVRAPWPAPPARWSRAARAALEVLGKSRLIRLGLRLSDEVLGAGRFAWCSSSPLAAWSRARAAPVAAYGVTAPQAELPHAVVTCHQGLSGIQYVKR